MRTKTLASLVLIFVVLITAVLSSLPFTEKSTSSGVAAAIVTDTSVSQTLAEACEAAGTGNCVSSWVGKYVALNGIPAAAEYIMRAKTPFEVNSCHSVMHELGIYAVENAEQDSIPALTDDLPGVCTFGYQHGIALGVAKRFTVAADYDRIAVTLCDAYKGDVAFYSPCVHGIGHGSIHVHSNDVIEASRVCESFGSEQNWCVGGAVMEWGATGGASSLLQNSLSLATSVCADLVELTKDARTADECAQQIAPIAYNAFGERSTILNWCSSRSTESEQRRCGQGVGYTFDREKTLDVAHIKNECSLVKNNTVLSGCLEAAAQMLYPRWAVPDETLLSTLCDGYSDSISERCRTGLERGRVSLKDGPSLDGIANPSIGSSL